MLFFYIIKSEHTIFQRTVTGTPKGAGKSLMAVDSIHFMETQMSCLAVYNFYYLEQANGLNFAF